MRDERGYVLALVAFFGMTLLGAAALAVDVGRAYLVRRELQDALDAAALAAVAELPEDPEQAREVAFQYSARQGLLPEHLQVEILTASEADGMLPWPGEPPSVVRLRGEKGLGVSFARVFGEKELAPAAAAEARVAPLAGARGAVPLGVPRGDYVVGERYALKLGGGSGERGNFHALSLGDGRGAREYEENLARGWQGMLRVGERVLTEPGNMSGPTERAVRERMDRARPGETFADFAPDSPRLLLVPVVDFGGAHGRAEVTVLGFAYFYLEGVAGRGHECEVEGRFVRRAGPGELGSWEGGFSWEARAAKLTR